MEFAAHKQSSHSGQAFFAPGLYFWKNNLWEIILHNWTDTRSLFSMGVGGTLIPF
jgi:hypothetical protein